MDSVSQWQFRPGTKEGDPVAVEATIEVNFRLLDPPRGWYPTRVAFTVPPGVTPPQVLDTYFHADGTADYGMMRLSFEIDADGHPKNVHIDSSSDHRYDDEVVAMISQWRFQSALDNGGAVASTGFIDLQRGLNPDLPRAVEMAPRKKQ